MKQTVLIGLGGTGSRVVNNVARELQKRNININDGIVTCCVLDTNQSDNDLITASGTAIPVIPTCDERIIDQYLALYANKEPRRWCPYSASYGQESMIDGASEIRSKSRIAFMDTMATGKILELQNAIEKVFHNKPGTAEKVRVLLVSSLAGGTGSGMFIQVALWLRKFFGERQSLATIRGIFLLPDIFIRTIPNVRDNPRKKLYHYANAYAAIRELNAINKVVKGNAKLEKPLIIDDLFDSNTPNAKPVFDNAFFIDDVDAGGAAFDSIEAYEEIAAQIVYMQLYAPMQNELISVEDNLFRAFESNPEPVYGSCGTAKAEYPVDAVAEYCALRATQDAISEGWNKIDSEIDGLEEDQAAAEKDGIAVQNPVSRRDMYVTLFEEKTRKKAEEMGADDSALFGRIKGDVYYETRTKTATPGKDKVVRQNKVDRFMNFLYERIKACVSEKGGGDTIEDVVAGVPEPESVKKVTDSLINKLKGLWVSEQDAIASAVETFEKKCESYADEIVRAVVPMDMGAVNATNERSLYGLFMKKDPEGKDYFVHPVAAKYLLYKLSRDVEVKLGEAFTNTKEDVLAGDTTISFDIAKTAKAETLEKYWSQLGMITSKNEVTHFIRQYKLFNAENKLMCEQYETELLTKAVLRIIKSRLDQLIEEIEKLFKYFPRIIEAYGEALQDNIALTQGDLEKTLYVYAKQEHKEAMYKSLGIDLTGRVEELNKGVIESVYGSFCVKVRPNMAANKPYADTNVALFFKDKALESFKKLIMTKHRQEICLTIIQAIEAESDFDYRKQQAKKAETVNLLNATNEADKARLRHSDAINACRDRLEQMARPFLIAQPDESLAVIKDVDGLTADPNNAIWMKTDDGTVLHMPFQTRLTFWGFHPQVGVDYPNIGAALGANKTTAANVGYGINELYCYTSIYGVIAEAIPKFNELRGGDYYTNYSAVINSMLTGGGEVATPHLDKTWHEFLPYVSASKEKSVRQKFYKAFWRAIAYGRISLDGHGRSQLSRQTRDAYGNVNYEDALLLDDGRPISKTDVAALISALKKDPAFEAIIAAELEETFREDLVDMSTYIGTDIVKGLMTEGDLNPVTLVTRYCASKGYSASVKADLVGALGEILREVAEKKDTNRGQQEIENAKIKLCHRVYEKCTMVGKKTHFSGWLKDFKRLKLAVTGDTDDTAGEGASVEDII
jgi:hypothetical protein